MAHRVAQPVSMETMDDPHVNALVYRFRSREPMDRFGAAEPLRLVLDRFSILLEGETLRAQPLDHYAAEEDARATLEPRLRDWEIAARLSSPAHSIQFEYLDAEVIDRSPTPGGMAVRPGTARAAAVAADASIAVDNGHFPEPDSEFRTNSLVESILDRLERSRRDQTRLAYDAYWAYVAVCDAFGSEAAAARTLGVSRHVLEELVRIANKRDPDISRKPAGRVDSITPEERTWLSEVMRVLARRAGWSYRGTPQPQVTLADLPPRQ